MGTTVSGMPEVFQPVLKTVEKQIALLGDAVQSL